MQNNEEYGMLFPVGSLCRNTGEDEGINPVAGHERNKKELTYL